MSRYTTPLPELLAKSVEQVLNRAIALDDQAGPAVRRLAGRTLKLQLEGPGIDLFFSGADERVRVTAEDRGRDVHTTISGTPASLLAMAVPELAGAGGKVSIQGDAAAGQAFQNLLRQLDPDWEAGLTELFGPLLGPQLYQVLRHGRETARGAARAGGDQLAHWLKSESDLVPGREQWARFTEDLDRLREAIDRLEGRLRRGFRT